MLSILLTQPVKIWWLLCIVKQQDMNHEEQLTSKTITTMGLNYAIDCSACGAHSEYHTTINVRSTNSYLHIAEHIDTECAIRCPVCRARLNNSVAEFHKQVTISIGE